MTGRDDPDSKPSLLSRRNLLNGVVILAGGALFFPALMGEQTTSVDVRIRSSKIGKIGSRFIGFSYEKKMLSTPLFQPDNSCLIELFKMLGTGSLRIGGNTVDWTHWNPYGVGLTDGETAPSDIKRLAGFAKAANWTVIYGVNLATSTPEAAAQEVAEAVKQLGPILEGIEIGNECDLYRGHYFNPWTLQDFIQRWEQFREAILKLSPHVPITGPASASNVTKWTIPFGEQIGPSEICLLTQHYYRGNGKSPSSTYQKLVSPDSLLKHQLEELQAGARKIGLPFRMAETNSFYNGGRTGVSDSYASALWVIDHCFNIAIGGAVGLNLHGGGASGGYTPIANSKQGKVIEARPEYYGVLAVHQMGEGSILQTDGGNDLLTVYAVQGRKGLNILINNKHGGACRMGLRLPFDQTVKMQPAFLSGPSLESLDGARVQGQKLDVSSGKPEWTGGMTGTDDDLITSSNGIVRVLVPKYSACILSEVH